METTTRREFIIEVAKSSGIAAGLVAGGFLLYTREPISLAKPEARLLRDFRVPPSDLFPKLVIVRGSDTPRMAAEAVTRLGGMARFIDKGDRVLLKPNVGWDRQPEQAANTGPELVGAVARLCREAGAGEVWVSDVSLNDPHRSFFRSGIEQAALEAGAKVLIPSERDFVETDMRGERLKIWPVSRFFHEADKVINLPIVKHHSLSGCTLAMKNWYGVIGGRRNQLHQDIHTSIVDLAAAVRPTLTIVDATRILKRNGPTGGDLQDVVAGSTLVAGLDEVALDAFCLTFLDLEASRVPYLAMAEKRGLGVVDWRQLPHSESQVG
ncbi:MAG: DUF362 domain-containing protein [Magnetococcales bacterium]|nr:DUF362 domain-containing protein [Magnetococcales bacterium]MBF0155952.1 DUF362 domain-containing protein [Magnetococcales bacterium]